MKISFRSAVMICGFIATVFYFFHPIVATAIIAVYLVHQRFMRKGREVPKMLTAPIPEVTDADLRDWGNRIDEEQREEDLRDFMDNLGKH